MNEFSSDHMRINLTTLARKTIDSDRVIFGASTTNNELSYATIINLIIENYDNDFPLDESLLNLKYEQESNVRLQEDVIDTLNSVELEDHLKQTPKPTISKYVRCLIETFARLPFIEQEKLLLKKHISKINSAIKNRRNLSLVFNDKTRKITPISIEPAKEGTFQYLIGMEDQKLMSVRLSRIEKIKVFGSAEQIKEKNKKQIDEDVAEYGPTFIAKQPLTVKVRLTPDGIKSYKYSVIHRPIHVAIEDNDVYVFKCSEKQALYFFFRFAGNAEILEPLSLREKFRSLYINGANNYK